MHAKIALATLVVLAIASCGGGNTPGSKSDDSQIVNEVAAMKAKVADLQGQIATLQSQVVRLTIAAYTGPQDTVWFDPQDEQKYQSVKAPAGPVLVVLEKVEPYLDGFTISMRLGNPSAAVYTGIKGKVKWGRKLDSNKSEDHNKLAEKEIDLRDTVFGGSWTTVSFKVAPATAEQVRRIGFEPEFNSLQLRPGGR